MIARAAPAGEPVDDLADGIRENLGQFLHQLLQVLLVGFATATEAGALAVALPVLGAVMGRAFATPSNLRTNILSVALGGSVSGKTSLVNPAKELLRLAGVPEVIGQDRIASGSGLLRMLTVEPRRICFLDEFGHLPVSV
jgi:hypothetical protein